MLDSGLKLSKDIFDIELLRISDITKFRTILGFLANQAGDLINYNNLANDSRSYFEQIKHYLFILEETFIIALLKPFFTNKATELKKNPKIYFVDTGIRNYILRNFNELDIRPDKGKIVENSIFTQLKIKQVDFLKYWRTLAKAEVDFIIEINPVRNSRCQKFSRTSNIKTQKTDISNGVNGKLIAIEVKYSSFKMPKVSRSFKNFLLQYSPEKALVLTKDFWGELTINKTVVKFIPVWYL